MTTDQCYIIIRICDIVWTDSEPRFLVIGVVGVVDVVDVVVDVGVVGVVGVSCAWCVSSVVRVRDWSGPNMVVV